MPKDVQIGADVEPQLRDQVRDYAAGLDVPESALITLLVARELRLKRLGSLPPSTAAKRTSPRSRLTGRQSTPALKRRFLEHVRNLEIAPALAIATLAEAELREAWLQKSLHVQLESK